MRWLGLFLTAGVLLAACSGGGDGRAHDATSTTEPKPINLQRKIKLENPPDEPRPELDRNVLYPESFSAEKIEVVEAYRAYSHAFSVAADPPDPDHPLLARHAAPDRLPQVQANIADLERKKRALRAPADSRSTIFAIKVKIRGPKATLESCQIDDSFSVDLATGEHIGERHATTYRSLTVLERHDGNGRWQVARAASSTLHKWQGVAGCAAQFGL